MSTKITNTTLTTPVAPMPPKKRVRVSPPTNTPISAPIYEPGRIKESIEGIKGGQHEALIIDAGLELPWCGEEMVKYWNARVFPEHRVPVPDSFASLNLKIYGGLPGIRGGMWHSYATEAHDAAIDSPIVMNLFTEITGTPDWKIRPNRFRFNPVDNDDGFKSAHLEGEHVMRTTSDICAIVCASEGRTFTYYMGSNNDERARDLYVKKGGPSSHFVHITREELKPWERVTVTTSKPGQIILFAGSVIHEVSRRSRSLSLFLSPYNPESTRESGDFYKGLSRTKMLSKQRKVPNAPLLPVSARTPGQCRQHPSQYSQLNRRETEIFGSLFNTAGCYWPSGKVTFMMFHMMAFNAYWSKLLPFCFDKNGKYNYEVITPELVVNCPDFDPTYFDSLPLAHVSDAEIAQMREKYTGIPEEAWKVVRYWTKDPRKCSDNVAIRRSYIK